MNAITIEKATNAYTNVIMLEVQRCDNLITDIKEVIAECGEDEELISLLKEYEEERAMWASSIA